ncbi:hypothetical protein [Fulvivirga lutea]|uniref:DUF3592 domain-containing protein n=1 Tax=Fulvivirga lutea TaxID=2810512 RepID=A0A975A0I1_9BACT|nr:hypothetical protein [Fulvivirga lutea]QSE97210.1 hypothetical protein JR347_16710 [Fulvivirga lutea]
MSNFKHRLTGPITKSDFKYRRNIILAPIILFSVLAYFMLSNSSKTLDDLAVAKGKLTSKEVIKQQYRGNNYRYTFVFKLNSTKQYFGIFLGSGENAIREGEHWNHKFKIDDNLKVHYDNNLITEHENITRLIRQIEKNGQIVYQSGTKVKKIIGFVLIGVVVMFLVMLLWLSKRAKLWVFRK